MPAGGWGGPRDLRPPKLLRESFIALIGVMPGASFSPEILMSMPAYWPSVLAIFVFIAVAQLVGFSIMRFAGGYSPPDALYASMPGGLIEASILGEKAGADPKLVSIQHFIRILLVVFLVPILFWVATGQVVGSAAGQSLGVSAWSILPPGFNRRWHSLTILRISLSEVSCSKMCETIRSKDSSSKFSDSAFCCEK